MGLLAVVWCRYGVELALNTIRSGKAMKLLDEFVANTGNIEKLKEIEGGGGLGFLHEAAAAVGIAGVIGAENFEGDDAIEFEVFGFIDLAHAAGANFLQDLILASNRGLHCFQSIAWVGLGSLA